MIGIYKITSPSGRIYIGQSLNIQKRIAVYKRCHCKNQPKLLRSLLKHGAGKHIFETIEECGPNELNNRERYWQEFYNATGRNGLNCMLVTSDHFNGTHSEESKKKMSLKRLGVKGKKHTEETKRKLSEIGSKRKHTPASLEKLRLANAGENNKMFGKKQTDSTKKKISEALMGRVLTEEYKAKCGNKGELHPMFGRKGVLSPIFGRTLSDSHKKKIAEKATGRPYPQISKDKQSESRGTKIINITTGELFTSINRAADSCGMKRVTLKAMIAGRNKNRTDFRIWMNKN